MRAPVEVRQSDQTFVQANPEQLSLFEQVRRMNPELSESSALIRLCEGLLTDAEAEPPIPIERVASLRGIAQVEERVQPWAGVLEPRGQTFIVCVRANDCYERQRFTVGHEAAHTCFPGFVESRHYRCDGERTRLEERCDFVATELLLPRRFFVSDLADAGFGLDAVEHLAALYQASVEATVLRVAALWPEPALVLAFSERHKPTEHGREHECEPKLRLDYAYRSGEWAGYFRKHKSVEADSPAARAHAGELVVETAPLGDLVSEDVALVEIHARRYGNRGRVLALIRRAARSRPRRHPHGTNAKRDGGAAHPPLPRGAGALAF